MARLIVVTHEFDRFTTRRWRFGRTRSPYMLFDILRAFESFGHSWRVAKGPKALPGDIALLHVDATVVAPQYLALAAHYPRPLNFRTGDISKRRVSSQLLAPGDRWDGPVIVKADLNCFGSMEKKHNLRAARAGRPLPHSLLPAERPYRVLASIAEVEDEVWRDSSLVVERFLPERDPDGGYGIRRWVFMGPRERCTRQVTFDPVARAAEVVRFEHCNVPDRLRAERERLGFDFGKFDFVMHAGEPVLLDANRTPGTASSLREMMEAGARNLAEGLDALTRS